MLREESGLREILNVFRDGKIRRGPLGAFRTNYQVLEILGQNLFLFCKGVVQGDCRNQAVGGDKCSGERIFLCRCRLWNNCCCTGNYDGWGGSRRLGDRGRRRDNCRRYSNGIRKKQRAANKNKKKYPSHFPSTWPTKLEIPKSVMVWAYFLCIYSFTLSESSICKTVRADSRTSS